MPAGKVKWFDAKKGWGFIIPDDGGEEIFAHYSNIESNGFRTLEDGEIVEFELEKGDKGLYATNISKKNVE